MVRFEVPWDKQTAAHSASRAGFSAETYYNLTDYLIRDPNGLAVEFDIENPIVVDMKVRGLVYLTMILPVYQLN